MKNWIYILIIGLMGSLVSSCQQSLDEEVQLPITTGKAQITFTIALDDIASRAEWEDNETNGEEGTVDDNLIAEELEILVHYKKMVNNNEVEAVETLNINGFYQVDNNIYRVEGELLLEDISTASLDCRLEVFANCTSDDNTFNYNVTNIPMWGTKTTTLQLAKGELTRLTEPIYLLRAMVKVEVRLADGIAEDFDITSVSVDKYNTTGYVLPNFEELKDTELLEDSEVFNPYESLGTSALEFNEVEEGVFTVYLPEYDNGTDPAEISLTINGKPYTIEFKEYVNGQATGDAYDIVRNHYYLYTITSVKSGLDLTLSVVPWTVKVDALSYTETVGYSVDESNLGWNDIESQDDGNVYLYTGNNVDAAGFKVKLMSPYGAKWMAVLEDAEDKFTFDTAGFSGSFVEGSTKTIEGNIGNDTEGTIVTLGIKAKNSSEEGEYSAELRLYVQLETGKWFEIDLTDGDVDNGVENYIINHLKSSV